MGRKTDKIDDLVERVSLYRTIPAYLHGTVFPFVILYSGWAYFWLIVQGYEVYAEEGFLGFGVIGVLQVLSVLCCYWSVHIRCFLSCKKVRCFPFFDNFSDLYFGSTAILWLFVYASPFGSMHFY